MSRLAPLVVVLLAALVPAAASEFALVVDSPLVPGAECTVRVQAANPGREEHRLAFPETLELVADHQVETARLAIAAAPGPVTLPTDSQTERVYSGPVPTTWAAGRRRLAIDEPGPAWLVVEIVATTPPPAEPESESEPGRRHLPGHDRRGLPGRYLDQFGSYQPIYFLAGSNAPAVKFQVSFKYQLVLENSWLAQEAPWTRGFHVAYSQTSLWDVQANSAPFFDSSYRPEIFWLSENLGDDLFGPASWVDWADVRVGLEHESNGRGGGDSRSINLVYVRPSIALGAIDDWHLEIAPKAYAYLDKDENPDIDDFRGHVDLELVIGHPAHLLARATLRKGYGALERGSIQFDLSYPVHQLSDWFPIALSIHGQFFTGYGESLLDYDRADTHVRLGFSVVR